MLNGKKVLIFDMDGTLIDSVGIWNQVDEELIRQIRKDGEKGVENIQSQRDDCLRRFASDESPYLSYCSFLNEKYMANMTAETIHELRYDIAQYYLESVVDYKENADIFIKRVSELGFRLCIATTTRRMNMDIYRKKNNNIISKANIDDYFFPVYTREDAREIKPNPEIYLRVMREMGVEAAECLVFEDSLIGIEASEKAGIESVAIYDQYSDSDRDRIISMATYNVKGYSELLNSLCC